MHLPYTCTPRFGLPITQNCGHNHPQATKQPLSTSLQEPIYAGWWSIPLTHHSWDLLNPLEWSTQIWNLVTPKFTCNPLCLNPNAEVDWRVISPTPCHQRRRSQPSLSPTLSPCRMQLVNPNADINRLIRSPPTTNQCPNSYKKFEVDMALIPIVASTAMPMVFIKLQHEHYWLHATKSMT